MECGFNLQNAQKFESMTGAFSGRKRWIVFNVLYSLWYMLSSSTCLEVEELIYIPLDWWKAAFNLYRTHKNATELMTGAFPGHKP
jgi:hypothetical protein